MIRDLLSEAWSELWRAKLRTGLAVAAIAVGAFAISLLAGVQQMMTAEQTSGPHAGWLRIGVPGVDRLGEDPLATRDWRSVARLRRTSLLREDAEAIRAHCPSVDSVVTVGFCGTRDLKAGRVALQADVQTANITSPAALAADPFCTALALGRVFTEGDIQRSARVAILSAEARGHLFGASDPRGAAVRIDAVPYEVVGVLEPGTGVFGPPPLLVPDASARGALKPTLWSIFVHAKPRMQSQARQQIDAVLIPRLGNPGESFAESASGRFGDYDRRAIAFYGMIAVLVLLSSGVALSNKLYVDVIERLHELTVRRAVGASAGRVRATVLLEGILLCLVGSALGAAGSWLVVASRFRVWNGQPITGVGIPFLSISAVLAMALGLGAAAALHAASVATSADPARWLGRKDVV